ncbi:MAG: hypothetical protein RLY92_24 [Chloroflexota bacterium]
MAKKKKTPPPAAEAESEDNLPKKKAGRFSKLRAILLNRSFLIVTVTLLVPLLAALGVFQSLEYSVSNQYFQLRGPIAHSEDIIIVAIDDESFQQTGLQWPWPRDYIAKIVAGISAGKPKAISIDAFFFEPSNDKASIEVSGADVQKISGGTMTSEQLIAALSTIGMSVESEGGNFKLTVDAGQAQDKVFAGALAEAGNVILNSEINVDNSGGASIERYIQPIDILKDAAYLTAAANFTADADGFVRRFPMFVVSKRDKQAHYTWPAMTAFTYMGQALPTQMRATGNVTIGTGPDKTVATLRSGFFNINFRGPAKTYRYIPAYQIPIGDHPPETFTDKIVLIGATSPSLQDIWPTPYLSRTNSTQTPGVEVGAHAIDTILHGDYIITYPVNMGALIALIVGLLAVALTRIEKLAIGLALLAVLIVGYLAGSYFLFTRFNTVVAVAGPLVAMVLSYAVPTVERAAAEAKKRQEIKGAFSAYLSPAMVEIVAKDPSKLQLGGEEREMTILFSDIRGFSGISELFDAHGLVGYINKFLTPMTNVIQDHKGTIDKYVGDCIMAFWNAPLDDVEHATNACACAVALNRLLAPLNVTFKAAADAAGRKHLQLRAGIGMNTGPTVVGNMGSDTRFNYTVMGDSVNVASRLESSSKQYGIVLVVGETTRALAPQFAALEIDKVVVKGKTEALHSFTLLGEPDIALTPEFKKLEEAHIEMLRLFRSQDWEGANAKITECRGLEPEGLCVEPGVGLGKLYDMYADRIVHYIEEPPGADWDGSYHAKEK